MFLQNPAFNKGTSDRVNRLNAAEAIMQTILYYRDYAERARRLMESGDRRSILQALAMLAQGFEEIANALESGEIVVLKAEHEPAPEGSPGLRERARAVEQAARFLSDTRH
jgi:lauroyl/myristoyl acyltransferase